MSAEGDTASATVRSLAAMCDEASWRRLKLQRRQHARRANSVSLDKAPLRMELLVTSFLNDRLDPLDFGLAELLVISCWHQHQQAPDDALATLLESFRRLEFDRTAAGGEVFSETKLVFWMLVTRRFLETGGSEGRWQQDAARLLQFYGRARRLPYRYYSAQRWNSIEARYKWLQPDLRPFPDAGRL